MKNIFGEDTLKNSKEEVSTFLKIASNMNLPKNNESLLAYIKKEGHRLIVSNIKELLFIDYKGNEENGLYNYINCLAFNKLDGQKDNKYLTNKYPEYKINMEGFYLSINKSKANLIIEAYKFISDDPTKYFMQGIHFKEDYLISTDGKRLFYTLGFSNFPSVIIPKTKMLNWLLKNGTDIKYKVDELYSVFSFVYKNITFYYYTYNIEGQFPNWKRVLPENQKYIINAPNILQWKSIYSIINKLKNKNSSNSIVIKANNENKIDIEWEDKIIGVIDWDSFYEKIIEIEDKQLCINYKYFDDALMLKPLKNIQFTEFEKVITFLYKDNSVLLTMPIGK